jgi:predicted  nucleic acid-binding Zn-ribbon protein
MKELMEKLLKLQTLEFSEPKSGTNTVLIAELRGDIPPQILGHYDRFRARGKKGLAAVNNQVCTACHMRQPLGVIMTIKHGHDIQLCQSCDRYLYLPKESENPTVEAPPQAKAARAPRRKKSGKPAGAKARAEPLDA